MRIVAACLVLLLPQDSPRDLVLKLKDEDAAIREDATKELIRLGEPARPAIERVLPSADPEFRERLTRVLKALDMKKKVSAFIGSPVRVSLSGELTLKEAAQVLEKAAGHAVVADEWPDEKFKLDLRDTPYWDAVEEVCAASGKRTPLLTDEGIKLEGTRYVRRPRTGFGGITVRIESVERYRQIGFDDRVEGRMLAFSLVIGWERSCRPVWSYWDLESAADDQGVDHKEAIDKFEGKGSDGVPDSGEDPAPVFSTRYYLVTESPPDERARTLRELKGRFVIWLKASEERVTFNVPEPTENEMPDITESVHVFDSDRMPRHRVDITRHDGSLFRFEGVDFRMVKHYAYLAYGTDSQGRRYPGSGFIEPDQKNVISFGFPGAPEGYRIESETFRIPRRVVQIEIPFAFRDIPVN